MVDFKSLVFVCFCTLLKGRFTLKNLVLNENLSYFLSLLASFGIQISSKNDDITIESHGALHLFHPETAIDVKGEKAFIYALCGLFSPLDYNIFFVDSTKKLLSESFSPLILGFHEAGIRFSYSSNFTLPFSMQGSSNFLPMHHSILKENPLLELAFFLLGLQGIGKTHVISPFEGIFDEALQKLNANFAIKKLENGLNDYFLSLHLQHFKQNLQIEI